MKQIMPTIDIVHGYPPELNGKSSLLKTPQKRVLEHVEIMLVLTWKIDLFFLAFILLEDIMHATGREK